MKSAKHQTFLKGAFILVMAYVLAKPINAFFKIPLANLIGKSGMGLFGVSYYIYTILFVISTAGFPIAISKMVAESTARGNRKDAQRVFETAFILLAVVGIIGSTVLFAFAAPLADMLGNADAYLGIMAIAPAVFFVSMVAAFKGYFQGNQNMYPTAMTELLEAMTKLSVGFCLAYVFMKGSLKLDGITADSLQMAAGGATFGVTAATFFAFITMLVIYVFKKKRISKDPNKSIRSRKTILRELLFIAVPITLGACVSSLTSFIDLGTIMNRLVLNPHNFDKFAHLFAEGTEFAKDALEKGWQGAELLEKKANALYGMYTGYAVPLFNAPLTFITALSISIVPAIAGAMAEQKTNAARRTAESAIKITTLFAVPCAVGIFVLAKPILSLLFMGDTDAASVLRTLAIPIAFVSLVSVSGAILQAYGKVYVPVVNMLIGGIIKLVINYFFIPGYGIDAVPVATLICYAVIMSLNMYHIVCRVKIRTTFMSGVVKPLASGVIMGVVTYFTYNYLAGLRVPGIVNLAVTVAASALVYLLAVCLTRTILREDVEMLPRGDKIANVLERMRLIKS